jgi:putative glutathione S-transferase
MPPPSGRKYKGISVPFFFQDESADAFRSMSMKSDDIILSSLAKGGTTWVHKILHSLLHVYDDAGNIIPGSDDSDSSTSSRINASGQVYPDALPLNRTQQKRLLEEDDFTAKFSKKHFGDFTLDDLFAQPSPRLFSTHAFGKEMLPAELLGTDEKEGKGRLIIVLRNLKDVMCSLHFFNGEAKDGWLGNEHGPGSFHRFIADDCPNAYGSCFDWTAGQDQVVSYLQEQAAKSKLYSKQRVLVIYFEAMKADLPAQMDRINTFLDLPALTPAKRMAIAEACGFKAMKGGTAGKLTNVIMRKGSIGDWRNHLTPDTWKIFDQVFARKLGNVTLAGPMRHFQWWEMPGMPSKSRKEWTLKTDPRMWPIFERVSLQEGMVKPDELVSRAGSGTEFKRPPSEYLGMIPSETYAVEAGRYHLFVSGICPWASSAAMTRHLLGLQSVISMDIADGQSGAGWTYLDGTTVGPWKDRPGPFWIHEAYQLDDPLVTSRITVPVLWDTKTNSIVSNDSWTIVKILTTAFVGMGKPSIEAATLMSVDGMGHPTLLPDDLKEVIETKQGEFYDTLSNGVYRAGIGLMMNHEVESEAVLTARKGVYDKLAQTDELLSHHRFVAGDKLTAVDVRLAMNLFRWDCAYREAFVLKDGRGRGGILLGDGYPHLKAYLRDLYVVMEPLVDFRAMRQYYRLRQSINKAFVCSNGETYEDEKEDDLPPSPDLNKIIASAKDVNETGVGRSSKCGWNVFGC